MKKLSTLLAAGLLSLAPVAANARILLPNLYAEEYCSLRAMGATREDAITAAVQASLIDGEPVKVTLEDGRVIDADVLRAARAVRNRCPDYLKD